MIYKLFEHIHLDRHNKTYHKLVAISEKPKDGSLNDIIRVMGRNKLSQFQDFYNDKGHCIYLIKYPTNYEENHNLTYKKQSYPFIETCDIETAFTLLFERKFVIERDMTEFLKKGKKDSELICFIYKKP